MIVCHENMIQHDTFLCSSTCQFKSKLIFQNVLTANHKTLLQKKQKTINSEKAHASLWFCQKEKISLGAYVSLQGILELITVALKYKSYQQIAHILKITTI